MAAGDRKWGAGEGGNGRRGPGKGRRRPKGAGPQFFKRRAGKDRNRAGEAGQTEAEPGRPGETGQTEAEPGRTDWEKRQKKTGQAGEDRDKARPDRAATL